MMLLLDLGNTRLKWALADDRGVDAAGAAAWQDVDAGALPAAWDAALSRATSAWAVSVAGPVREARVGELLSAHAGSVRWLRTSPAEACGVRNGYPLPGKLGIDRFLAMVAARVAGHAPCIVASAGTALALDALDADGRHLGGLIAPGARLMQQALHQATARLPDTAEAPLRDAANDTESAIVSGCRHAVLGLIERFHARMAASLRGADTPVLLCGGDAAALAGDLAVPAVVCENLVLQGLAAWARADES